MALREVDGPAGSPWEQPLQGRLEQLVIESELLRENPLADPARRPLYVYVPPEVLRDPQRQVPSVYLLQGYGGQLDAWLARKAFEPTIVERLDVMFAAGNCPPAVVVFVDAWTSLGGSQFLNSSGTGRYSDYICDEVVPFVDSRYPTLPDRDHRGICGHSSGGYGALALSMLRADVFGALASHAGDALFESCYVRDFALVARTLRDQFDGSYEVMFERLAAGERFEFSRFGTPLSVYAYAAAYSPDRQRPGRVLLPFDTTTGRLVDDVWELWLQCDPVRMVPQYSAELRSMRRIVLEAGRGDEYFLDLGAQAVGQELSQIGAEHTLELFDGGHGGISHRYPGAIRELVVALAP